MTPEDKDGAKPCTALQLQVYRNGLKNVLSLYKVSAESKLAYFRDNRPTIAQVRASLKQMTFMDTIYFFDRLASLTKVQASHSPAVL